MKTLRYAAAVVLLSGITFQSATSQSLWYPTNGTSSIGLEILKPSFATETDEWYRESYGALTGAAFLHGRARLTERVTFVADLPIAHAAFKARAGEWSFSETETSIGNPYLGIEHRSGRQFVTEAGVRLPLAPSGDLATLTGVLVDFDRFEAFAPKYASALVAGNLLYQGADGTRARVRVGPSAAIFTGEQERFGDRSYPDRMDLWLAYNGQVGYAAQAAEFGIGLTGRMLVTESGGSLGDRTVHHAGVSAAYTAGRAQPGIHLRIPLDRGLRDALGFVLGLNMSVRLN